MRRDDEKLGLFIEQVVTPLVRAGRKLLVFTEYRATQIYLKEALDRSFGHIGPVALINGSMKLNEKLQAIQRFNEDAPFLISTEAGGEGINLHHACHVMVNYDLPWNPARLVQRIGRLYRYGQRETVLVFNLHARDSFDNAAIDLMLSRVDQIVRDMAPVGSEFNERLHAEIVGEILENLDLASLLQQATEMEIERTREQIEEAIARAREAQRLQSEIFAHVPGYDPNALRGTLGFTMHHVRAFIEGVLPLLGISIEGTHYGGAVMEIRLPEEKRGAFPEFGQRTVVRITTDRRLAQRLPDVVLLDFETSFFRYLVAKAKSYDFGGVYACVQLPEQRRGVLAAFRLRWQNDQGEPLTEEFVPMFATEDGRIEVAPPFLAECLVGPLVSAKPPNPEKGSRSTVFDRFVQEAHRRLGVESTRFKHPNGVVPLAAADCRPASGAARQ